MRTLATAYWRWAFPLFEVLHADRVVVQKQEEFNVVARAAEWLDRLKVDTRKIDTARNIYDDELVRIRRLEDKLTTQLSFLTPLTIFVTGLVTFAIPKRDSELIILAFLAVAELASAYFFAARGHSARQMNLVSPTDLEPAATPQTTPEVEIAARRMAYVEKNQLEALRLNNWISGAQACLLRFMIFLGLAGLIIFLEESVR